MDLSDDAVRSIVAHLAHLRAEWGEVLGEPDLIEPNGTYFPDPFALEPESIDRLMRRMLSYAPLAADLEVALAFLEPEGEGSGKAGGCGSGACGTDGKGEAKDVARGGAIETEDGYAVVVATADVGDPTLLTTSLARAAGRLVLHEAGEDVEARDEGPLAELTAVACGFGLLLLNGSCVYKKGCGGMRRHQGTFLGTSELALALALFVRVNEVKAGLVKRHLEVTQRESFDAALDWVDGQPKLVAALRDRPETLADGVFALEQRKGLLSRLFKKKDDDDLGDLGEVAKSFAGRAPASARSDEERRRIAETKALVEEALQET